jgi:TonB family protein
MRHRILFFFITSALIPAAFAQARTGIRVTEEAMRTLREKRVDPIYPQTALKTGNHGLVELQIKISESGDVQGVKLNSGNPVLAPSAMEAVKQWHYKPYLLNGVPIIVFTRVTLDYELSSGKGAVRDAPILTISAKKN